MKQYLVQLKDDLVSRLEDKLKGHRIIDVIFFPGLNHKPMVRIDGDGMSTDEAGKLESSLPELMVRLPNLTMSNFNDLLGAALRSYPEGDLMEAEKRLGTELRDKLEAWLGENDVSLDGLVIWEVDVDGNDASVRLVGSENRLLPTESKKIDGVKIEYISELSAKEGAAMLRSFDASKKDSRPYLVYWQSLL